ncbi:MAG: hypothetical protein GY844_00670 [Bradyrhizobium sp.]|nr:hypothetical protein [Bradyrhizobium sp.]
MISRLIAHMKRLAGRAGQLSELWRMDERQVGEIAHDLGLSRFELTTLCANVGSGDLLKRRLAQFALKEEMLAKSHPDVLQDLQRVCGTCTVTSRCAHDFAVHRDSDRDGYCPNTCTLYALKQERLGRKDGSCCAS